MIIIIYNNYCKNEERKTKQKTKTKTKSYENRIEQNNNQMQQPIWNQIIPQLYGIYTKSYYSIYIPYLYIL